VNILDIEGSLIRTESVFRDNTTIDVSGLSEGIYFIELTEIQTKERFVEKLTKL
jgi:hypothetical protein